MSTRHIQGILRFRAWFTAGLAVFALASIFTCTISDDNGSPASPGDTIIPGDGDPVDPNVDPEFLVPQVPDMRPVDTLSITVALIDANAANASAPGIANAWVTMTVTPDIGWQNRDSVRTDAYGLATFQFTDTAETTFTLVFHYGNRSSTPVTLTITPTPAPIQRLITVRVDDPSLVADGKSYTNVYVTVINEAHNPLVGEAIQFTTTAGVIAGTNPPTPEESGIAVTDENGVAIARLVSTAINDTATVWAYLISDLSMNIETRVAFQGVHIDLEVDTSNLRLNQTSVVTATVLNGSNEAIAQYPVQWLLGKGNTSNFTIVAMDTVTGFNGEAVLLLRADVTGTDSVIIASAGARSALSLNVTDLVLSVSVSDPFMVASDTATTELLVLFSSQSGTAIENGIITIVRQYSSPTGAMLSTTSTALTDASGRVSLRVLGLGYDGTVRLAVTARQPATQNIATAETQIKVSTTRNLTIEALPNLIKADGSSTSEITVTIKNAKGNPMVGDTIDFSTTAGVIAAYTVTGQFGQGSVELRSDRRNVTARVKAVLRSDVSKVDSVNVLFTGVNLVANASPRSIRGDGTDTSYVSIVLSDAMGNVIPGENVNWSVQQKDSTIILDADPVTDNRGEAQCKVVGTGIGTDTLTIQAANAYAYPVIFYSSNSLIIDTASAAGTQPLVANGIDSTRMRIRYRTGSGTPIPNVPVAYSVTMGGLGTLFAQTGTTDVNGEIVFHVRNPSFATMMTVAADATTPTEVTSAARNFYFRAGIITKIDLTLTPKTISTGGDKAMLQATAFDALGNRVAGQLIAFNQLEGPGGGERFDPPTSTTGLDGVASSSLISGEVPSMFNEVEIVASDFAGTKSNIVKMTIAGPAHAITVRSNILTGLNPDDGTFGLPCAAIVSDVNGNPVADGTPVTFSCVITGFVSWRHGSEFHESYIGGYYRYYTYDTILVIIPFEDMNNNYQPFELAEDRNFDGVVSRGEDWNGDGRYFPGPGFEDINHNGLRDSGGQSVEPFDIYQRQRDTTVKASTGLDSTYPIFYTDTAKADYNRNGRVDLVEPLLNRNPMTWEEYIAMRDTAQGGFGFDYIFDENGVADPHTAVKILRTVQTESGIARNEVWYGQSDAGRIQVSISAEAQGKVTDVPDVIILPIIQ